MKTELQRLQFQSMIVRVLAENTACQFYERMGGVEMGRVNIVIDGQTLEEVVYVWSEFI
ncbi:MAG: hypothetical protein ACRC5C_01355 [Bacilli bacterium]